MSATDLLLTATPRADGATQTGDMTTGQGPTQPCPTSIERPATMPTGEIPAHLVGDMVTGAPSQGEPGRQI